MNLLKNAIVLSFLFLMISCSDGSQINITINDLIKKKKLTTIVIEQDCNGSTTEALELDIKKIKIEQQFIINGEDYYNLGQIRTMRVEGKKLRLLLM